MQGGGGAPHHRLLAPPPGVGSLTMRLLGPGLAGLTTGFWPHPLGGSIWCPQGILMGGCSAVGDHRSLEADLTGGSC